MPQTDANPRDPEPGADTPQTAPRSAAEVEIEALAQRLRESAELAEPLGVCVFPAGAKSCQATATRVQCELLSGTWLSGAPLPDAQGSPGVGEASGAVAEALAELEKTLAATPQDPPPPLGTCVYAAGNVACRAEMTELQCDLLGGIWFGGPGETATAPGG